ncbi:RNB domain-containing ribonuclease, partial [uncultured Megasphaera sp.]|uniref:RNB domain-containing ribonuclease n=1 Tax=uncultured Megasphaera sp. TaxID=165188 RepID=UPI0028056FA2
SVYFKVSKDANKLVEEFMLLANKQVATDIGNPGGRKKAKPFVYRIHDNPDPDRMTNFAEIANRFGYKVRTTGKRTDINNSLNKMLSSVKGKPEENLLSILAIRSMSKAVYSTVNVGHYGLAFDYYTHFTSPIRRYPDLMVHRLIRQYQKEGKLQEKEAQLSLSYHTIAADQASTRERVAVEAERETDDLKKCQYMLPFIGQPFQAHITGITSFGVFVGLENGIEGLVHISLLTDDDYEFDEASYTLRGQHGGKVYRLGDAMEVTLAQVNVEKCEIDFVPGRYESLDDVRNLMAASAERRHKRKSHDKKDTDTKRNWFAGAIGKKGKKDKKDKKGRKDKKAGRKAARKGKNTKRGKGRGKKKKK